MPERSMDAAFLCPKCGQWSELYPDVRIFASPVDPTLTCEVCDTDWRISLWEVEREPTERQLERMASGDHYPDYDHQMAEARKLK